MERISKWIWLSCGALLLIFLLVSGGILLGVDRWFFSSDYEEAGVAINNDVKQRLEKKKLSLTYQNPGKIGRSNFYLLPVYISYEENSEVLRSGMGGSGYYKDDDLNDPSNIIFLGKDHKVIRTLLSQKALITEMDYPNPENDYSESVSRDSMNYILYQIAFKDSDNNGQIDTQDDSDLFISSLDGNNLTQITKDWKIHSTQVYDNYKTILIRFSEKTDIKSPIHLASYTIASKELKELTSIDEELKKIEHTLIK